MGKEADALATQAAPSFEDITIDYYKPFLAFAEANKWVEGKAEKKFGFNDVVTVKEFTAMLLRALGHDTMGENYAKVMDLAKEQGLFQGVMAEEAAPVIRGVAFIMMNNTLETAPKGEKQALVYKLGYKEMPKPENFAVTEVMSSGLKTIDVKFTKEVDENSLDKIVVKDGTKFVSIEKKILLDNMTVRIILASDANQDKKFTVIVEDVKVAGTKEVVEKHEATVFMTDATRPEVLSVEALNPKTLLVKVSEPIKTEYKVVKKLDEFKIEGKALYGKIVNNTKNEVIVELNKALKPGDYKVEVSGLKDYANFIAKTAEFDITVVEDKDAPMITEAKMISLDKIKVTFNEGIHAKGMFKVNGNNANLDKDFKNGDSEGILELGSHVLTIGAVVEVKVEYKGQKDIMGNMVKDWAKFTFKVEDDATLPEVKEVTVNGSTVQVEFTKNMLKKGTDYNPVYMLMKDGKTVVGKTAIKESDFNKEGNVLELAITALNKKAAADYTLVLDGLKDSTVRMNSMPKTEVALQGKDTERPGVSETYKLDPAGKDKYLMATLYFTEEMDEETLLDKKNYTFSDYTVGSVNKKSVRADAARVSISIDDGGKAVIIQADDLEIKALGKISLVGLKDKAGNMLVQPAAGYVKPHETSSPVQAVESVTLVSTSDEPGVLVKAVFKDAIPEFAQTGVVNLVETSTTTEVTKLTLYSSEDMYTFYFTMDKPEAVSKNAVKTADHSTELDLHVLDGTLAKSILGDPLAATGPKAKLVDRVVPALVEKATKGEIKVAADRVTFEEIFDQKVEVASAIIRVVDQNGKTQKATVEAGQLKIEVATPLVNGNYTVFVDYALDKANNVLKDAKFDVVVEEKVAEIDKLQDVSNGSINNIKLDATMNLEFASGKSSADCLDSIKVTYDGNPVELKPGAAAFTISGKTITIVFNAATPVVADKTIKVEFTSTKHIVDAVDKATPVASKVVETVVK